MRAEAPGGTLSDERRIEHHTYRLPKRTLSRREQEVVVLLCEGYELKEIADLLGISHHTVGTHMDHIRIKLDLRNVAQVVRWAVETQMGAKAREEGR